MNSRGAVNIVVKPDYEKNGPVDNIKENETKGERSQITDVRIR